MEMVGSPGASLPALQGVHTPRDFFLFGVVEGKAALNAADWQGLAVFRGLPGRQMLRKGEQQSSGALWSRTTH